MPLIILMDYGLPEQNLAYNSGTAEMFSSLLFYLFGLLFLFVLAAIIRKLIRAATANSSYFDQIIYLIRLPKEKPKDLEKDISLQQLREEISRGEILFSSIGGLRAERGFLAWLLGRNDHYSFEIVASRKVISFYLAAPRQSARYLEQQIQAYYPEAVMEEVADYNLFAPQTAVSAGYLKTKRSFVFPIKTYNKMEVDPLNSIVNAMSKLNEDEGMAIQYVVRSAKGAWHSQAGQIVTKVNQGKPLREIMNKSKLAAVMSVFSELLRSSKPKDKEKELIKPPYRLTQMEEQVLKAIEEKNAKAGLDVNIRIVVSSTNRPQAQAYLDNLASAYGQYNLFDYGNGFKNKVSRKRQDKLINDFIYRRLDESIGFLLNSEELASLYHFPLRWTETPNIYWLTAKHAAAPSNLPDQGIVLGKNIYRGVIKDVQIKREDRRRHTYIIGKSGVGKSVLLASMAIQDIANGEGVCLIDPHGDLIEDVLKRIPPERAEDVILFSPGDTARPLALNLLEYDPRYPEQKTFVINEMIKIFDKLYDLKATGGPIFEQYMRNAMLLIMDDQESGSTLMEIPKVLADPDFRRLKLARCHDPTVVDFWKKEAEKAGGEAALANIVPYVTSKLTSFISNDTMRPIIGQQKSSFNLRDIMDGRKILLVNLPKGRIGELNAYLLGMIMVGKILAAALSRTDLPPEQRKDFYLYIDEFQNFTTDSISAVLSEARKYNLNLIMAHQYLGQLIGAGNNTAIRDAVFGNVGTWVLFKIGSEDAAVMEKEFAPVFNQYDLINIEKYTAYIKLLVDNTALRPFSLTTLWPPSGNERADMAERIKSLSRLKYGQERSVVEAEILRRTRITTDEGD